ncbi:hypothetical protein NPIL_591691 [Nephila pilipes]|uniref:Uncharacterized protein n=1 Tax=Nephila pilipes TaxID=299642 RepID=A0A8X6UQC0_NEPPI|nr:hypothetical protein NPIL_591691 [Nephila pilipes]
MSVKLCKTTSNYAFNARNSKTGRMLKCGSKIRRFEMLGVRASSYYLNWYTTQVYVRCQRSLLNECSANARPQSLLHMMFALIIMAMMPIIWSERFAKNTLK